MNPETTPMNTEATDGSYPVNYPRIRLDTNIHHLSDITHKAFIEHLRNILKSGDECHDIDLLRKSSQIFYENMFVEVELFISDLVPEKKVSITLALYVLNANVIAYKSEENSFFFKNAPSEANTFLFNSTNKHFVNVSTANYNDLPDRSKIVLSRGALMAATGILHDFKNTPRDMDAFNESLVVVLQMISEAARFKFIQRYVEFYLKRGYTPRGDGISYENSWGILSQQIQLSDSDGKFQTPVLLQTADYFDKYITNVAQVKSDIAILLNDTIFPTITYNATGEDACDGAYGTFINTLRSNLTSGATSHDIPLLQKSSEITDENKFVLVELFYDDASISATKVSITLALDVVNVQVIGYKSEANSFFFDNAPSGAQDVLFNGTTKQHLYVYASYDLLGVDRSKIPLWTGSLKRAINILYKFDGKILEFVLKESLVVVMQMVSDATRFKFIQQYIESNLIDDGYTPKGDTISYENKWCALSKQIQLSGEDGKFKKPVHVKNADNSNKTVSTVAEVKPYIAILLNKQAVDDDDDDN